MLVDANILLYAVDENSPRHAQAKAWLEQALNGERRTGLPWLSLWAFIRISTNPRASASPLTAAQAAQFVAKWLSAPTAWIPAPTRDHLTILSDQITRHHISGALVTDAILATLAIEHGLSIVTNDSDFARFPEVNTLNPVGQRAS